ncbi:MAG: anthranilate phosphoribosyltransferase [Opitutaceae bacterium]|nr:anthranilate phosphoribosyltransferase [Opitutaceae bacterium]
MDDLKILSTKLASEKCELNPDEIQSGARLLTSSEVAKTDKEEFLTQLALKGETGAEIAGFASAFRSMARNPGLEKWASEGIDVCGTGGDHGGTFNISTTVAFILAAAGIPVLKHGNRSITSKCGSSDLLEALGIKTDIDEETIKRSVEELNFVFLLAPAFHPAFKEIVPVRKALAEKGQRTVFNILGPLINPAQPAHQLVGVFSEQLVPVLAAALHQLGLAAGFAVHGAYSTDRGLDELTTTTRNRMVGFGRLVDVDETKVASDFGLAEAQPEDLAGGDLTENIQILENVLSGVAPSGLIDTIVLNAATGLFVVGKVASITEGIGFARDLLLSGAVRQKIADIRDFYQSL